MRLPFSSRGCALSLFHSTLRPSLGDLTTLPWRYYIYTSHGRHQQSGWHCNSTFTSSFGEGNSLQVNGRLQLYFYSGEQCRRTAASRIQFSIPPARSYRGFASSGASPDRGLSRAPHSSQPGQLDRHNVWLSSKQWLAARRPTLLIRSLHP